MILSEVKKLIKNGETTTVEFKRKIRHPEKVVKELVAFANTQGGYLFIGINDDGTLAGVKYPEDEIFVLNNAISKYCRPVFNYSYDTVDISENRHIIVYNVPLSDRRPHCIVNNDEHPGTNAFVRVEDRSIKASKQVKEILNRQRKNKDVRFSFGEKEKLLMDYLERNNRITLREFKNMSGRNDYHASRTLILMVLANVLEIHPSDKEDFYTVKTVYEDKPIGYSNTKTG